MGLLSWLTERLLGTAQTNHADQSELSAAGTDEPTEEPAHGAWLTPQANEQRDFFYGMLYGSLKHDFQHIHTQLQTLHNDLNRGHNRLLHETDKRHHQLLERLDQHKNELHHIIQHAQQQLKTVLVQRESNNRRKK